MDKKKSDEKIKKILKDKCITVGGRNYDLVINTTMEKRVKISSFLSRYTHDLQKGDMSFTQDPRFKEIKEIIDEMVLFEKGLLSKDEHHWDYSPIQEFYIFYVTMMSVMVDALPERPTA